MIEFRKHVFAWGPCQQPAFHVCLWFDRKTYPSECAWQQQKAHLWRRVSDNQFVMFSVSGRRKCTIDSNTPIYYQIISLVEGTFSRADFIVLSAQKFSPYQNGNSLVKVCKEVNANGNQIIMPYNKASKPLLSLGDWHTAWISQCRCKIRGIFKLVKKSTV